MSGYISSPREWFRGIAEAWWQMAWGGGLRELSNTAAASSVDPVYLSGERLEQRPIEVNSGASEDGRSRVLEA